MKKVLSLLLVVVFVLAFSSVAFAASECGLDKSPAFDNDANEDRYDNVNNDDLRFFVDGDRAGYIVIPTRAPGDANEDNDNSAIWRAHVSEDRSFVLAPGHLEKYDD